MEKTYATLTDQINDAASAKDTFDVLSLVAMNALSPRGRAEATSKTLLELSCLPGMDDLMLKPSDALLALTVIWSHYAAAHPSLGEPEATKRKHRAKTIREIGEHLGELTAVEMPSDWNEARLRAHKAWLRVVAALEGEDPRTEAIRSTWAREALYLAD